jgi:hypothetical protein
MQSLGPFQIVRIASVNRINMMQITLPPNLCSALQMYK